MSSDESGRWSFLVAVGTTLFATLLFAFLNYIYSIAGLGWRPTLAGYTGSVVITYAGLGLVAYGGSRVSKQNLSLDFRMPTRHDWGVAVSGAIVTLFVGGTLVAVVSQLNLPIAQPNMLTPPLEGFEEGPSGPERLLAVLPLLVLVVVPVEELLFRTVVQTLLERLLSPEGSIITTSVLFALFTAPLFYGAGVTASVVPIVIAFILSLLWGDLYRRTGTVLVPTIAHAAPYVAGVTLLYLLATLARA